MCRREYERKEKIYKLKEISYYSIFLFSFIINYRLQKYEKAREKLRNHI